MQFYLNLQQMLKKLRGGKMSCTNCCFYFLDEVENINCCHWIQTPLRNLPPCEMEEDCYSNELEENEDSFID